MRGAWGEWGVVSISRTKKMLSVQTGQQMSVDCIPLWPVSLTWGVPPEITKGRPVHFPCAPSPSVLPALPCLPLGLGRVGRLGDESSLSRPPGFSRWWDKGIF